MVINLLKVKKTAIILKLKWEPPYAFFLHKEYQKKTWIEYRKSKREPLKHIRIN